MITHGSLGQGEQEQLRNEWQEMREEGISNLASQASVSEYDPDDKPGPQEEVLLDSLLAEQFRTLEELSEAKKMILEREAATELLQKETERLEGERASLEEGLRGEKAWTKQLSNELQVGRGTLN